MTPDHDIAIIGGGAAGIAAARRLAGAGRSTVLLEATSRLGGRAWTHEIAGQTLDLGCGWLHSADRNPWTRLAEASGVALDRREPAWGVQFRDLGFSPAEQDQADQAFAAWREHLSRLGPQSDRAADALATGCAWNGYIQTISGFISGAGLERISAADLIAYDTASTDHNWRAPAGYGALISASLPSGVALRLSAPVEAIDLDGRGVTVATPVGAVRARVAILTVSTAVLASEAIKLPPGLDPWRRAAALLPLGRNEKLFFEIVGDGPFEPETQVIGNPRDPRTGAYYIRPFGRPVIEGFLGGDGARRLEEEGPAAGFAHAVDELAALFGSEVRERIRPLVASSWGRTTRVGGAYSYALAGHVSARRALAEPFEDRLFFAGEATHQHDFSTAHGAHDSGVRAAEEALAALDGG